EGKKTMKRLAVVFLAAVAACGGTESIDTTTSNLENRADRGQPEPPMAGIHWARGQAKAHGGGSPDLLYHGGPVLTQQSRGSAERQQDRPHPRRGLQDDPDARGQRVLPRLHRPAARTRWLLRMAQRGNLQWRERAVRVLLRSGRRPGLRSGISGHFVLAGGRGAGQRQRP